MRLSSGGLSVPKHELSDMPLVGEVRGKCFMMCIENVADKKTKALLQKWNVPFEEVRIDTDRGRLTEFARATNGARTVPQILIDGRPIGGFTELTELDRRGLLDELAA